MARVMSCCAAVSFLHLTCVAAVQMINDINHLKGIQSDLSVPRHSLKLLHWFANQVDVRSDWIRLNFNPNYDYGSHHYVNIDGLLPYRPPGYLYYTIGNINQEGAMELPDYVRHQRHHNNGYNRARIIFRVHGEAIDQVYLTQHYSNSQDSSYDPNHTYEISSDLLRELRRVPRGHLEQFHRLIVRTMIFIEPNTKSPRRH